MATKSPEKMRGMSKTEQLQAENERLQYQLREQHTVLRELAAFTEGVMLSEYVNGVDDQGGYAHGKSYVRGLLAISDRFTIGSFLKEG